MNRMTALPQPAKQADRFRSRRRNPRCPPGPRHRLRRPQVNQGETQTTGKSSKSSNLNARKQCSICARPEPSYRRLRRGKPINCEVRSLQKSSYNDSTKFDRIWISQKTLSCSALKRSTASRGFNLTCVAAASCVGRRTCERNGQRIPPDAQKSRPCAGQGSS